MTELTSFMLERLWEDGELVLFRGKRDAGLAVSACSGASSGATSAGGHCATASRVFARRGDGSRLGGSPPDKLVHHEGRPALVMEDPGGDPLERLLGHPMEPSQFLRIAIGIAVALGSLHGRGIIHRNVKPGNMLADSANGHVWLTGFGIASPFPRERQLPEPPAEIAGTLAYMAPEQTGRMNRSIDSRSDLYAYGVTLYEMLTGVLPFTATDPMEWVHCHIARHPVPPNERLEGIPEQISAIVMKLLAKTPEERYQTASGVEADLRSASRPWSPSDGSIRFPWGCTTCRTDC